jgi:hypothetical protein
LENSTQNIDVIVVTYKLRLWATASQDEYDCLRPLSCSGANAMSGIISSRATSHGFS